MYCFNFTSEYAIFDMNFCALLIYWYFVDLDLPIDASLPNFLFANASVLSKVNGLHPQKIKHRTLLDIEPVSLQNITHGFLVVVDFNRLTDMRGLFQNWINLSISLSPSLLIICKSLVILPCFRPVGNGTGGEGGAGHVKPHPIIY